MRHMTWPFQETDYRLGSLGPSDGNQPVLLSNHGDQDRTAVITLYNGHDEPAELQIGKGTRATAAPRATTVLIITVAPGESVTCSVAHEESAFGIVLED